MPNRASFLYAMGPVSPARFAGDNAFCDGMCILVQYCLYTLSILFVYLFYMLSIC